MDFGRVKGWLNQQKTTAQESITRFKNKAFLDAVVAGCALVAAADGKIDASEKQKMAGFIQRSQELKVFDMREVIQQFNQTTDNFEFDFIIGKATALQTIGKIKHNEEASRLLVRVCCAIGLADGDFDDDEKAVVREICQELNLNPDEFDLRSSAQSPDNPPRFEPPIPPQPQDNQADSQTRSEPPMPPEPPQTSDISPPPKPPISQDSSPQWQDSSNQQQGLVTQTRRVDLSKTKPSGLTIAQKGHEAYITTLKNLTICLQWATTVQFELAAVYEGKNGQRGWVHSGDMGNLNAFPFMYLNMQGNNEKTLQITSLSDIKTIHLFCFDKNLVNNKQWLQFKDSDIYLSVTDETKKNVFIEIDSDNTGNICQLATIDNSGIMGAKLINVSQINTLDEVTLEKLVK